MDEGSDYSLWYYKFQEKTKKILDIWTKSATFPPAVLTRLENVLKGDDAPVPAPVLDAVIHSASPQAALNPPETPTNPASQAASVQAALLALLSQARNVPISAQTTTNNIQPTQVQLDANQLKLFQQLTQTVNPPEITTPPIQTSLSPPPAPSLASPNITAGPSNQPTYWNQSQGPQDKPWDAGRNYPISSVEESDHHSPRGRFRGGFRSRARGRYVDRDREGFRDRFHDRARSPGSAHERRSRSRSPPRSRYAGGRRDVNLYSPPRRPSATDQTDNHPPSSSHPGVDEFGREIRPSSDDDRSMTPDDLKQRPALSPPPATSVVGLTSAPPVEMMSVSSNRESESPATAPSQSAFATGSGSDEPHHASGAALQSFDYTTFDPTSPASWDALGKAWAATNGRSPTQEELMMFVMEFTIGMASQAPPSAPAPVQQGNPQAGYGWMGEHRGGPPRGRGAFRGRGGRGGFAHSAGGGGQKQWDVGDDAYAESTDAIVLGEHTNNQNGFGWTQGGHEQAQASPDGDGDGDDGGQMEGGSTAGGRMQKVGDNWVFVKDDGSS